MADAFTDRVYPVVVHRLTTTTVDFEPVVVDNPVTLQVAIQMAEPEDLKIDQVDWSKQYIWAFSQSELMINDEVEYCGERFRVIKLYNAKYYGYWKAICEEVKKT